MKLFAIFTLLSVVGAFVPKGLAPAPFVRSVDVTLQRDDAAPGVKPLESGYASFAELGEDILAELGEGRVSGLEGLDAGRGVVALERDINRAHERRGRQALGHERADNAEEGENREELHGR